MLRRKSLVGLVAGVALAAVVTVAVAAEGDASRGLKGSPLGRLISGCIGRMMVLRSELNLSDQQREEIGKILKSHRQEIVKQAEAVWKKRVALREAVLKPGTDEKEIRRAASEMGQEIGDAAVLAAKLRGEIAPVLNDEQRQLVQKRLSENVEAVEKFFAKASKAE